MYIRRAEIEGFGKLNNLKIEFSDGFNIIFGANESGKSTLQSFLKAMLYGLKSGRVSKDGLLPPSKRFLPWGGEPFRGSIEYSLDNGQVYIIQRDFNSGKTSVFDSSFKDITEYFELDNKKNILIAQKHLGINEECFLRTAFVKQMKTTSQISRSSELESRLINTAETGFEETSFKKAEKLLSDALKNHIGTDKTSTRPLDIIKNKIHSLINKKAKLLKKNDEMFMLMETLGTLKEEVFKAQRRVCVAEKLFVMLDTRKKALELNRIFDKVVDLNQEIENNQYRLEKVKASITEIEGLSGFNSSELYRMQFEIEKMLELKEKCYETEKRILQLEHKENNKASIKRMKRNKTLFSLSAAISGVLSALSLFLAVLGNSWGYYSAFFMACILFICLIASYKTKGKIRTLKDDLYKLGADTDLSYYYKADSLLSCQKEIDTIMERHAKTLMELGIINNKNEIPDVEKIRNIVEKIKTMEVTLPQVEYIKDKLLSLKEMRAGMYAQAEDILKRTIRDDDDIIDGVKELNRQLENFDGYEGNAKLDWEVIKKDDALLKLTEKVQRKDGDFSELKKQLEEYKECASKFIAEKKLEINKIETLIESHDPEDELQKVEEELEYLKEEASLLEEKQQSLKLALDVLRKSADYLKKNFAPLLCERLNENIKKITSSRYVDLRADDKLNLRAKVPQTNQIINIANLSGGTVEQMYLAMRIAMLELIEMNNEKIPLFLDEIFAHYDDDRVKETLKMLYHMSKDRQIILSTCKTREVEIAKMLAGSSLNIVYM